MKTPLLFLWTLAFFMSQKNVYGNIINHYEECNNQKVLTDLQNNTTPFVTVWNTYDPNEPADRTSITIPTFSSETYDYEVDWTYDGVIFNAESTGVTGNITHDYGVEGVHTVAIRGTFPRMYFNNSFDPEVYLGKIIEIKSWGDISWTSMEGAFDGCENLQMNATDVPDLSGVTSLSRAFRHAKSINSSISNWDVSNVTDMNLLFSTVDSFNQPLNSWNVSNVTNMSRLFFNCHNFNQPLNNWNVSNVENMSYIFNNVDAFDQDITGWVVDNVRDFEGMLNGVDNFNQDISGWNMTKAENIDSMFSNTSFNQDISGWNVSNVTNMDGTFADCPFNQDISNWNVSNVTDMSGMFAGNDVFNQPLNTWNVSNVTNMSEMFYDSDAFNQPLNNWDVSKVTDMSYMFSYAIAFNQPLNTWITTSLENTLEMFYGAEIFNQPLPWNTSKITDMAYMFGEAFAFNQDIGKWDLSSVTDMSDMFDGVTLPTSTYDAILIKWSRDRSGVAGDGIDDIPNGIDFSAGNSNYCVGATARESLVNTHGWSIDDGTLNCGLSFRLKVFLQGPSLNPPSEPESTLMRDDLRVAGILPVVSPYSDELVMNANVLQFDGSDAPVDWILIELRDKIDNTSTVASRSALVLRNGDVVDIDGVSPLSMAETADSFYIVIKHRNHLGVMSNAPIALSSTTTFTDFSDATNQVTYGDHAQTTAGTPDGIVGMWAGDVNVDEKVIFLNTGAESVDIKQLVLDVSAVESPFGASVFYKPQGYYDEDIDMDGQVIFLNAGNELIYLKDNVLAHPNNQIFNSVFFTITGQLP